MQWKKACPAAALATLLLVWGWYYLSPRWTLQRMRSAAFAHDVAALSTNIDYPALRASIDAGYRAGAAELLAQAPPEIRPRVAASLRARWTDAEIDRQAGAPMMRLMFGCEPTYCGWASGTPGTGRRERIVVRGPNEFRLYDRNDPYPDVEGDLTFRRYGLTWKLVSIGAEGEEFPEEPPPSWWQRILAGHGLRQGPSH